MPFNYKKFFRDDRKYFTIVFFIVLAIIISGIITPVYINYKRNHWNEELKERVTGIEASVKKLHKEKETYLSDLRDRIRGKLKHVLGAHNTSYGRLIQAVNKKEYSGVSVEVIAPNGRIIAWNRNPAVPQEEIFPFYFPAGETYFYNSGLYTYLSVLDTLTIDADQFYFIVSLPYEKKYTIQNEYYQEVSFINTISARHMTQFEIDFTPYAAKTKDGRKYSFELLNNKNNKIALVTFFKPAVTVTQNNIYNDVSLLQTFLALLAFITAGMGFRKEYKQLKNSFIKLILFTIYFAGLRIVLFLTDIPSRIMEGPLTDPANFSSAFGWGIVKSPVDFFLTVFLFLLVSIRSFSFLTAYITRSRDKKNKSILLFLAAALSGALAFFITLRGFSASLKSVIFDSSLRYFRGAEIIPEIPVLFMLTAVLILALAVVLFLASYLILVFRLIPSAEKKQVRIYSVSVLAVYLVTGIVYILTQSNPLISLFIALLFMAIIWIYIYQVYEIRIGSVFNYVYAALIGSALSISLLNSFNVELELETLKTTAAEINRPDENLIKFLISEALISSARES